MAKPKVKRQAKIPHLWGERSYEVMWDRADRVGGANGLLHLPNPTSISPFHHAPPGMISHPPILQSQTNTPLIYHLDPHS